MIPVVINLTSEEKKFLDEIAQKKNKTPEEVAKEMVLENIFTVDILVDNFKNKINSLKSGQTFTIKELFALEWKKYSVQIRISLGRKIISLVKKGKLPEIEEMGKDLQHSQVYRKN